MERLTRKNWRNLDPWEMCGQDNYCKRGCHDQGGCTKGCIVPRIYGRLAAYEDTGLEPEDIISAVDMAKIACALHELNAYKDLGPIDHIRDLIKAEQDGKLVVIPCAAGDVIYEADPAHGVVKHTFAENPAWMMHSYAVDDAGNEWYDGWGSSDETPFYKTREEAEAALAQKGGKDHA